MNKMFKKMFVFFLMMSAACLGLFAGELTLNDAVSEALQKSKTIKTARNNYEKELNSANVKSWLPTLSASASVSEDADLLHNEDNNLKYPTIRLSTGIAWKFSSGDFAKQSQNNLSALSAELNFSNQVNNLIKDVSTSYFKLISLKYAVEQAENSLRNSEINYSKTLDMYNESKASELTLLQSEISCKDSVLSLETAKTNYENALYDFKVLTGIDTDFDLAKEPELSGFDYSALETLAEEYYDKTNVVKKAEIDLETAKRSKFSNSSNNRLPSVSLDTGLKMNWVKTRKSDFEPSLDFNASVTATIPIDSYLPWTQANATVKNSDVNICNAELALESAEEQIRNDVRSSLNQIFGYADKEKNLKEHLSLSEKNYSLVLESYNAGYSSYVDLEVSRYTMEEAEKNLTNNKMNIINQLCSFASLLGLDFDGVVEYLENEK